MTRNEILTDVYEKRNILRFAFIALNENKDVPDKVKEILSPYIEQILDGMTLLILRAKMEGKDGDKETECVGQSEETGK